MSNAALNPTGLPKYHTTDEVAAALAVTPETVCDWIRKGRLKAVRISRKYYRVTAEQLQQYIDGLNPDAEEVKERKRLSRADREFRRRMGVD